MKQPHRTAGAILAIAFVFALGTSIAQAEDTAAARALLLSGKYAQAIEAYEALSPTEPVAAAIGLTRARAETGQREAALKTITAAVEKHPKDAALAAELARQQLDAGNLAAAEEAATVALALDDQQLLARFVRAELHRRAGRLNDADAAYKWFIDYYNAHEVKDAEALDWIAQAAAQFARWHRLKDQFSYLVNEVYPTAAEADPQWWAAHYHAGLLFLEKYNQDDATREFRMAQRQNPNAASVHAALARLALQNYELDAAQRSIDRALDINPTDLAAQLARGDVLMANFQAAEAIPVYEEACRLYPLDDEAHGRLAGAYAVVDGLPNDLSGTRVGRAIEQATERNEHCGEFFASLAAALDASRKFPAAARYYREAIKRMPQLIAPHGELGIVEMRLGEEQAAQHTLEEAFVADPFNVRVNNMLKVLEVLDDYAVLETDHFIIRFDRVQDEILARYVADYLESDVYPELCAKFGFAPQEKSLFEIFNRARSTRGHGWFSARMIGLPFVHTVGACAGKVVALASPNDMPKKYNWARVVKHEFVHVLNLQQTDFSIPHWFTEALAVGSEGYDRPQAWNALLAERVPKNELFNLDTINLGFVRPQSSDDWQMAYCQADLYARYMTEKYGPDALAKMLAAYRDNLETEEALRRALGVEKSDFEKGYLEYVRRVTSESGAQASASSESFADLIRAHEAQPDDATLAAKLATAYLSREDFPHARELATAALGDKQAHQQAAYVLALVHMQIGENDKAAGLIETHLDRENPDPRLLNLSAGLQLKAEDYARAEELYRLGADKNPADPAWPRALARVYLRAGNDAKLTDVLSRLAGLDPDDLPIRKKLAQLALDAGDVAAAEKWARSALHIDVMDADIHRMLGEALGKREQFDPSADEYEVAVKLAPKRASLYPAMIDACLKADRKDKARTALAKLETLEPDNPRITEWKASLDK